MRTGTEKGAVRTDTESKVGTQTDTDTDTNTNTDTDTRRQTPSLWGEWRDEW